MTDVEGVDLGALEDTFVAFENAVSAALAQTMRRVVQARVAGAQDLAGLSLDDLNLIPGLWAAQVPALAQQIGLVYLDAGNMQGASVVRATGGPASSDPGEIQDPPDRTLRQMQQRGLPVFISENASAAAHLAAATNRLVGVGDELWAAARRELLAGFDAGESIPKLAVRVRGAAGVTDARARTIARTEVTGAANAGSIAYMRATGLVRSKTWLAHQDGRERPSHNAADGQQAALDGKFSVGGYPMDHPGDPSAPASETANCRCTLIYGLIPDAAAPVVDSGTPLAAAAPPEDPMPWHISNDSADCPNGFAVIQDDSGELTPGGCHDTEADAQDHMAALYANEPDAAAETLVAAAIEAMADTVAWEGVLCALNTPTGDRRQFEALTWAELPLPLRRNIEESHGGVPMTKAVLVGRIDEASLDGDLLRGRGVIDLGSEYGREAARLMGTKDAPGFLRGVSIDGDETPGQPATVTAVFAAGCAELSEDSTTAELMACMEPELTVWSSVRVRGATLTDIAALDEAMLYLVGGPVGGQPDDTQGVDETVDEGTQEMVADGFVLADVVSSLTAAAHSIVLPSVPPIEWFEEPAEAPEIGAITITDEGRLFGYLAPAGVNHRAYAASGRRREVPKGNVDYGLWLNKPTIVSTADGSKRIATGAITMGCGHMGTSGAGSRDTQATMDHYENSCSVFATVNIGENKRGVWVAGAVLCDVTPGQLARALACQLSGDWRPHSQGKRGWTEFAAALVVPVGGFPYEHRATVTRRADALVASSVPIRFEREAECEPCALVASAAANPDRTNAARMIAQAVGWDRSARKATRAREIYQSVAD